MVLYLFKLIYVLVLLVLMQSLALLLRIFSHAAAERVSHAFNQKMLRIFGVEMEMENHDKEREFGRCVFVLLNQTSLLDGAISIALVPRPLRFITNIEFALIPFYGWAAALIHCVVIIRQWPEQARKGLNRLQGFLRRGGNVFISIEGKRSLDGRLQPYKKGPVVLAIKAQARVIPVYIEGARMRLPYGSARVRSGKIRLHLLPSVSTEGLTYEDKEALKDRLREIGEDCLRIYGSGEPKKQ